MHICRAVWQVRVPEVPTQVLDTRHFAERYLMVFRGKGTRKLHIRRYTRNCFVNMFKSTSTALTVINLMIATALGSTNFKCTSSLDCQLNGACETSSGTCVCDRAWKVHTPSCLIDKTYSFKYDWCRDPFRRLLIGENLIDGKHSSSKNCHRL